MGNTGATNVGVKGAEWVGDCLPCCLNMAIRNGHHSFIIIIISIIITTVAHFHLPQIILLLKHTCKVNRLGRFPVKAVWLDIYHVAHFYRSYESARVITPNTETIFSSSPFTLFQIPALLISTPCG